MKIYTNYKVYQIVSLQFDTLFVHFSIYIYDKTLYIINLRKIFVNLLKYFKYGTYFSGNFHARNSKYFLIQFDT